jgi:hypothetical protein
MKGKSNKGKIMYEWGEASRGEPAGQTPHKSQMLRPSPGVMLK